MIDNDFRLMYKSSGDFPFNLLACFIKNANLHKREWLDNIMMVNDDTSFVALDEITHELKKIYKSNIIFNFKRQGPSIGWYTIEILSALIDLDSHARSRKPYHLPVIWLIGFDLSPVYVFERLGTPHDFVYEYIALQVRYMLGLVKNLAAQSEINLQLGLLSTS